MDNINPLAASIVKAIAYTENGGHPTLDKITAGKTGELKSIFQFTHDTWKNYSKQAFGKEVPLTPDNETAVVLHKVNGWLDKGYTAKQIASMWNAGSSEPDAHTGKFSTGKPSVGINKKYGVKYNVPAYANKVDNYVKQFIAADATKQPLKTDVANSTPATTTPEIATNVPTVAPILQPLKIPKENPAKASLDKIFSILGPKNSNKAGLLQQLSQKDTPTS